MMLFMLSLITLTLSTPLLCLRCIIPGTPAEELRKSTAVFAGKVIGRSYAKDSPSGVGVTGQRLAIKLQVERVWKGKVGADVLLYTSEVRQPNGMISMMA